MPSASANASVPKLAPAVVVRTVRRPAVLPPLPRAGIGPQVPQLDLTATKKQARGHRDTQKSPAAAGRSWDSADETDDMSETDGGLFE